MLLTENDLRTIVKNCIGRLLKENYLDNIYLSPNFMRWFAGSKMVDEKGRPLLLGHATRSFGFDKFNTPFIHLSSINDASFFSGGNRRLFIDRSTIDRLSDEEVVDLYNKYFTYNGDNKLIKLTDDEYNKIISEYNAKISKLNDQEDRDMLWQKYRIDASKIKSLVNSKDLFVAHYNMNRGNLYFVVGYNDLPRLTFEGYNGENVETKQRRWIELTFPTTEQVRQWVQEEMFKKDNYAGRGGIYPLCARVVNPLHINCNGNTWDQIYIRPDNCEAYSKMFDLWENEGLNKRHMCKNSWFALDNESIAYFAEKLGYDGVVFHNIREGAYGEAPMKETYIVFSTKQLKSPFENNGEFGDVENMFK